MKKSSERQSMRFQSIDGLRGIAAMGVVLFHLSLNLKPELDQLLPGFINAIMAHGYLGVPIFFVISGFVISLGIGTSTISRQYFGTFILRRSIRLDLTYWASIVLVILLAFGKNTVLGTEDPLPSGSDVLLHMFYLQSLANLDPVISVVYWTLCLEVQFYIFYITSLWLSQKLQTTLANNKLPIHLMIIVLLGIYSIAVELKLTSIPIPGLFIASWHYFLLGVLISNVVRGIKYSQPLFFAWLLIEFAFQYNVHIESYTVAGLACSILIYSLWKTQSLNRIFVGRVFKYFGTISYTLYLIHPDIGWKIISLAKMMLGEHNSPMISGLLLIFSISVCIAIAHIFHLMFEKPSLWLCNQLKHKSFATIWAERFGKTKTSQA
jgi:peptidoglycan/LPS O-acetylase OafA/YrhL